MSGNIRVTMQIGPMANEIRKTILQDFGNKKKSDYLNKELPKVVNK